MTEKEIVEEQQKFIQWLKDRKMYNPLESAATMQKLHAVWKAFQKEDPKNMSKQDRMKEVDEISNRVFNIANSFAGDETGNVAMMLHGSCNKMFRAQKVYNGSNAIGELMEDAEQSSQAAIGLRIVQNLKNS